MSLFASLPRMAHDRSGAYARLLSALSDELRALEAKRLRRRPVTLERIDGPLVRLGSREAVNWCSNDYLGLAAHPALAQAASRAAAEWGIGARASRLLCGTSVWHVRLEEALAEWFGMEAAIVYPSGYLANLGTLGTLLSAEDVVVVDRLAHASLIEAARASRARMRLFRHNDPDHLSGVLSQLPRARRRFIVTEGVFSMEGDRAPLQAIVEVAEAHEALVYLDDAHGAFVLGSTGCGSPEAAAIPPQDRFLYMGTLGKALGSQGGFIVGPAPLIEVLRNRSRPFVYTTALATPVAAAAVAALALLKREPQRRDFLQERVLRLHERLSALSLSQPALQRAGSAEGRILSPSHIVPIVIGKTERALEVAERLWQKGHWAPAIRPPTVPEGSSRLRLSLTFLHTDAQVEALALALKEALSFSCAGSS